MWAYYDYVVAENKQIISKDCLTLHVEAKEPCGLPLHYLYINISSLNTQMMLVMDWPIMQYVKNTDNLHTRDQITQWYVYHY